MMAKIDSLLDLETKLYDKAYKTAKNIAPRNKNWEKDIRYTTFNTLSSVIRYARLNLIFREEFLEDSKWWNINYDEYFGYLGPYFGIAESDRIRGRDNIRQPVSDDFVKTMIVGLYSSSFSIMESRFRLFYNYLIKEEQKASIKGGRDINNIIKPLLCELNLYSKIGCIDLFRVARNTIHNNGVHTHNDTIIYCKQKPYPFFKGKPATYGDSLDLLILKILPEVIEIFDKIIERLSTESAIVDPFAVDEQV
jgi:hypothetical protein